MFVVAFELLPTDGTDDVLRARPRLFDEFWVFFLLSELAVLPLQVFMVFLVEEVRILIRKFSLAEQLKDRRAQGRRHVYARNVILADVLVGTQNRFKLLLLFVGIYLEKVHFLRVQFWIRRSTTTHHVSCLLARSKTGNAENAAARLFFDLLPLRVRHLINLGNEQGSALHALGPVYIYFQAALDVPL